MENNKKKIIIVGAKEKISPTMLENIQNKYGDVEIEFMTKEEYKKLGEGLLEAAMEEERKTIELYLKRLDDMDYLPPIEQSKPIKQNFPRKTGKVHNKPLSSALKQYNYQRRTR